ncbi:MAG TPA: RNA polymerase sigma factor [Brevundimonas sp.]|nr:RNA polymerase sigma factor [Brevundimonas sp.]
MTLDDPFSDAALVARAAAGSDAAFGRLVQRHQGAVRAFVRRVLGGDRAEADDVSQDAFLAAWSSLRSLRNPDGVRSWLCGIAWRKAQDRIRSRRRAATRDADWVEAVKASPGVHPQDRVALTAAMAELSPETRACVALCLAEGWSHSEAAVTLALPLGTVKSHIARGRARLLGALGGPDDA